MLSDRQTKSELECIIPFSPERKCQTTVIRPEKGANFVRVVMKGAVDVVLAKCTSQIGNHDEIRRLDYAARNDIRSELNSYAKNFGNRIFAYAYKDLDSNEWERQQALNNNYVDESSRIHIEEDLTFAIAFILKDPIRENVGESILNLTK